MDSEQPTSVEIQRYAVVIWRWLWLIALATVLAAGLAFVGSRRSTPIYEASTTLLINEGQKATGPDYNAVLLSERLAKTYSQMLKSTPVLAAAGLRLGLTLGGREITVEPVRDTQLVRLKARHVDAATAAAIANTVPQVFIHQNEQARAAQVAISSQSLKQEMDALQAEIAAAQKSLDAERSMGQSAAAEVARLETLLAQLRATYSGLLGSYEEIRVAEARAADSLTVVEPAVVPVGPVLPRTSTNTLLAGVVGAMLATGAAFLIEYLDDTIKQPEDVERTTRLPVFASVARFTGVTEGSTPLVVESPQAGAVESYRMLRTNLQCSTLDMGHSAVTLLVTSAQPGEGKTTTLANLGVILAQSGKRVLLVDTDLRRPALHKQFGLRNSVGLTSLLLDHDDDPERCVQSTKVGGLRVLTAGPVPANPAGLLDLPATAGAIGSLRSLADYVLLDSPPVLSAADASILAQKVDGVLMVVETGHVRSETFRQAVTTLQRVQAKLLGVVLNKMGGHPGGYYYYYYHYDHGKPDGERKRRRKKPGQRAARHSAGRWAAVGRPLQQAAARHVGGLRAAVGRFFH